MFKQFGQFLSEDLRPDMRHFHMPVLDQWIGALNGHTHSR
jgi:hypothetical protein